jgi:hypothetical protein
MGAQDMERQALNVFRMRLLGAEVQRRHLFVRLSLYLHLFFREEEKK